MIWHLFQLGIALILAYYFFGYTTAWLSGWLRLARSYGTKCNVKGGRWSVLWPRVGRAFLCLQVTVLQDGLLLRGRVLPPFNFIRAGLKDLFIPWQEVHDVSHVNMFGMRRVSFKVGQNDPVQIEIMRHLIQGSPIDEPEA